MGTVPEIVNIGSQRLLAQHGGLRGLFLMDEAALARVRGLAAAEAVRVKAA
jgi:DNA repair protein RadC